jgi:hypothetical protein
MNAKDTYLQPLTEEIYYSLRRAADEAAEKARLVCEFEDMRERIDGRWVDVKDVTLVNLGVYVVRRVRFKEFKRGKIVSAEKPVVARWTTTGWQDVVGYLRSTTASLDGIQVLV